MSGELEEKEEKFERGQPQKIELVMNVKSIFYYNQEKEQEKQNFSLKKLKLFRLNILGSKREYFFFIKEEKNGRIYYIPYKGGYIKLQKDRNGNVIFSVFQKPLKVVSYEFEDEFDWQSIHTELVIEGPLKAFMINETKEPIEYILEFLEYP